MYTLSVKVLYANETTIIAFNRVERCFESRYLIAINAAWKVLKVKYTKTINSIISNKTSLFTHESSCYLFYLLATTTFKL